MISIILCTYNRAHTLRETIDSILAQTYGDFELIIVDDGSTDNTAELLSQYGDRRIRVFWREENQNYCVAANYGIEKARGEYIAFATSDDLWKPEKLSRQMEILKANPQIAACFTFSDVIDENSEPADGKFEAISGLLMANYSTRKEWIQQFIFMGNCLCHPSAVIRKTVMEDIGDFNLLYCQSADLDMWIRIVRKYQIHVIEEKLVHYRCYKDPLQQISGADEMKAARFFNEHMLIRRNFIEDLSEEELCCFFGDHFRKPDAQTHLELEIERAFLLMDCTHNFPGFRVLGIDRFEKLLRNRETLRVLKESYGIGVKDIYEWNRKHFFVDFGVQARLADIDKAQIRLQEQELALNRAKQDEEKKIRRIEELEELLDQAALAALEIKEESLKKKGKRGYHIWKRER